MNSYSKSLCVLIMMFNVQGCLLIQKKEESQRTKIDYFELTRSIKSLKRYNDGKLNGECLFFFINGTLEQKLNYKDGRIEGHVQTFYPSGAIQSIRTYKNGKMIGVGYDYWDGDSAAIKKMIYFNENGEATYIQELQHGKVINEEGIRAM